MLNYLLEFDQQKLIDLNTTRTKTRVKRDNTTELITEELNITSDDVFILHYIVSALCSENTKKEYIDGKVYVWLKRSHILESLPILDVSENRLSVYLNKLECMGLITTKQIGTRVGGSRCYIAITNKLISCMNTDTEAYKRVQKYDNVKTQSPEIVKIQSRRDCENTTSDNKNNYNKNNTLFTATKETVTEAKPKISKGLQFLYDCTDDEELVDLLVKYYNARRVEPSTRISMADYKYAVDDLFKLTDDIEHLKRIVIRTTQGNSHRVYRKWVDPDASKTSYRGYTGSVARDIENLSGEVIPTADENYRKEVLHGEAY